MPTKGKAKRTKSTKKKITKKTKSIMVPKTVIPKGPFKRAFLKDPVRPYYKSKFTYSEAFALGTGAGGVYGSEAIFRLNSLFDPNWNVGGHQPYGFDQIFGVLYRKYLVYAVMIDATLSDPNEDGLNVAMMIQPSGGVQVLAGTVANVVKERPNVITFPMNDKSDQIKRIRQFLFLNQLEGITRRQYSDQLTVYGADYTADPTRCPLLRMALGSDRGTATGDVIGKVTLTYYAYGYDRIGLAQS